MVANADILPRYLVGVVQRRPRYRRTCELRGPQLRNGGEYARAPDLHRYRLHDSLRALGLVFVGPRPARAMGGRPKRFVKVPLVELYHGSVYLEREGMPPLLKLVYGLEDAVHRRRMARPRRDGEAPFRESGDHLRVRRKPIAAGAPRIVYDSRKGPLGRYLRVKLLQRACAGVAWIRKLVEPGRRLPRVELEKALARHVRLAAHFKFARRIWRKRLRNRRDSHDVRSYVVSDRSVPARRSRGKPAVPVSQRYRNAVNLRLNDVSKARHALPQELVELLKFLLCMGLVERLHRRIVSHLCKAVRHSSRDFPDGGVLRGELRVLALKPQ